MVINKEGVGPQEDVTSENGQVKGKGGKKNPLF